MAARVLCDILPHVVRVSRFKAHLVKAAAAVVTGPAWPAQPCRLTQTVPTWIVEHQRKSELNYEREESDPMDFVDVNVPNEYRHVYPEFLPRPGPHETRDRILMKLERRDMMRRRAVMDIPEFYVGSVLAVTVADKHAPGKTNRFVGLCIARGGHGLNALFVLRNAVDGEGIEIMYHLYNPTIQSIQVLKLEKRLDDELYYLRDAPIEYSTVPFDLDPVVHAKGTPVPVNEIKVPLNPRPWRERWERHHHLRGYTHDVELLSKRNRERMYIEEKPWEKWDLMKEYRRTGSEALKEEIYKDVYIQQQEINKVKETERMKQVEAAKAKARVKRTKRTPVTGAVFVGDT